MRAFILLSSIILFMNVGVFSQWSSKFTSLPLYEGVISGWMNFEQKDDKWDNRMYYLDAISFNIMSNVYSTSVEYTYNFTPEEILAGYQIYSLRTDVTGDKIVDFYVVSYWNASSNYRKSFKIIDITNGCIVFERNDPSFSFSVPAVWDIDNDKMLECVFTKTLYPSGTYYYQEVFSTGNLVSSVTEENPGNFTLKQNYPNPFNPSTSIEFTLDKPSDVKLEIYDVRGRLVRTLLNSHKESGSHKEIWDGLNDSGIKSASGIYIYNLKSDNFSETRKMVILK